MTNLERRLSLSPGAQQRIGALVVLWGMFEGTLEIALWALRGENPAGARPTTDGIPVSRWIIDFRREVIDRPSVVVSVGTAMCDAAEDLLVYRNAIVHGWFSPGWNGGTFISNPSWHGEKRKRASSDAHVDEHLLNLAIEAAQTLVEAVSRLRSTLQEPRGFPESQLHELVPALRRARSSANELRHLTALMNHEKY